MKRRALPAQQVYITLLHLYPADFRRDYAEELALLFIDMHRAAAAQGTRALVSLWLTVLLDVVSSAIRERMRSMFNPKWAAVISAILLVPVAFFFSLDLFNYEPRFVQPFFMLLFTPDDFNIFGRMFEGFLILSAPVAFVINLLSMLRKANPEQPAPFSITRSHTVIGSFILLAVLILFSKAVLFPLRWIGPELGEAPILGQVLCLLAFLPLPALFLLGRLPRLTRKSAGVIMVLQPTSVNLITGAALLLVVLMEVSGFVLEAIIA